MMVAIVILALILAFAAFTLIRAWRSSMGSSVDYKPDFTEGELNTAAQKLGDMVRVQTVSKNEEDDLSDFVKYQSELKRLFPLLHEKLELTNLNGTLLFRWQGSDSSKLPILFMGHQDVVPASDEGWSVPAYSGAVVNGCLYGRGSLDCKSTMYVEMQAVEELLAEGFTPNCDIYLEYSINEETGGKGASNAAKYLKDKGIRLAMVLDEGGAIVDEAIPGMDRPYAVIGITEKGYMDLKITARGKGGHSSTPPRNTPAARLFAFAHEMEEDRPFQKKFIPEVRTMFKRMAPSLSFGMKYILCNIDVFEPLLKLVIPAISPFGEAIMATTCCFTMMEGSAAPNVIAKEPYLIANLRTSVHQNCEQSLAVVKRYADKYGLDVEVIQARDASAVSNIASEQYAYLERCIADFFPDCGCAPYVIMGGTDCRHFHQLTENALRFMPVRSTTAQNGSTHAVDENVTVSALAEGVRFFKKFIKGYNL